MNLPGTEREVTAFRDEVYRLAKLQGYWDRDPSMAESLVDVISALTSAAAAYDEEKITGIDGAVSACGYAVVQLLDLAGRISAPVKLWDGMTRHHTDFYPDLFSIMARILRLKENYPDEAIAMIEKLCAAWVDRATFWGGVVRLHQEELRRVSE